MIAAATVHFPGMTAWPERATPADLQATQQGFARIGQAYAQADIRTLIVLTSEHIVNLQPRMAPAFVIGTGATHAAFPEPHFNLDPITRPGHPDLAHQLVTGLYTLGLDPAHAHALRLDHGTTLPLQQLELPTHIRIIPILINTLFPPLPPLARCRQLGQAIAQVIHQTGNDQHVGILATGGVSHAVGEPGVDDNDPAFDRDFIDALLGGNLDQACAYPDAVLDSKGNGTHEIRSWIAAAATQSSPPQVVTAIPYATGWNAGVHQLLWETP